MSERKWTPGPWSVSDRGTYAVRTADQRRRICYPEPADNSEDQMKHNAHLIAAAPDLYESLEFILSNGDGVDGRRVAKAALAKARGEA